MDSKIADIVNRSISGARDRAAQAADVAKTVKDLCVGVEGAAEAAARLGGQQQITQALMNGIARATGSAPASAPAASAQPATQIIPRLVAAPAPAAPAPGTPAPTVKQQLTSAAVSKGKELLASALGKALGQPSGDGEVKHDAMSFDLK